MKLFLLVTISLCVLYSQAIHGIVINDITVPNLVTISRNDSNDTINLDCDYELSDNEPNLLVKWFMNNKLIYQWIRGHEPAVLPYFRDFIELSKTSDEPDHEYRGLTLTNINIQLNGTYRCSVHTGAQYKSMEKDLHIVDISDDEISFNDRKVQNETHLECTVSNIFPKPILTLVSDNPNTVITMDKANVVLRENAHFDASLTAVAQNADGSDNFDCYVSFEGLPFNISAKAEAAELNENADSGALNVNTQTVVNILFVIVTLLMF
ncbi:uncharacterized protein LOC106083416 [Stomoxys calcitrans]|uniref:uncharacterized protein LOC106083416 n=1 Tax=Stomoxys calcitrans TaxID=35570 RepID=UPI0027E31619|nr:uncharacterized protein LOC106083416 [Stomoxys calcitrans]